MTRSQYIRGGLLAMVGVGLCVPVLWAQTVQPRTASTPDAALLAEVRALRADLAEASRNSLRAQLLVARVQLQEQRIIYFDRRRAEAATRVAEAAEKSREAAVKVTELEEQQRRFRAGVAQIPKPEVDAMVAQLGSELDKVRGDAAAAVQTEQRLRTEEAGVASALADETGRWTEFNTRLDELERALPK
jgi:hypothetical protein